MHQEESICAECGEQLTPGEPVVRFGPGGTIDRMPFSPADHGGETLWHADCFERMTGR